MKESLIRVKRMELEYNKSREKSGRSEDKSATAEKEKNE